LFHKFAFKAEAVSRPLLADSPRTCAILNLLLGVFGSILAAHFLRRYFPRLARLAFGDR
jgi:energy-converting hydrogenase Eha subunit A